MGEAPLAERPTVRVGQILVPHQHVANLRVQAEELVALVEQGRKKLEEIAGLSAEDAKPASGDTIGTPVCDNCHGTFRWLMESGGGQIRDRQVGLRQAELGRDNDGDRCGHGDAERAGLVEFGDL